MTFDNQLSAVNVNPQTRTGFSLTPYLTPTTFAAAGFTASLGSVVFHEYTSHATVDSFHNICRFGKAYPVASAVGVVGSFIVLELTKLGRNKWLNNQAEPISWGPLSFQKETVRFLTQPNLPIMVTGMLVNFADAVRHADSVESPRCQGPWGDFVLGAVVMSGVMCIEGGKTYMENWTKTPAAQAYPVLVRKLLLVFLYLLAGIGAAGCLVDDIGPWVARMT